jgi:non-specific serine/threonine protein kinase
VALLTLPQIAARLDDRFHLLTGGSRAALPRQQTLQALIDWSYELLPEAERTLLRRLSVFAGGWTLEAAEAVCADQVDGRWLIVDGSGRSGPSTINHQLSTHEVLDLLSALEEKSLVLVELRDGAIRYRMLETVREYAREKLKGSGELAVIRDRHRDWYLQLAEQFAATTERPEHAAWLIRMEAERDNLWAALAWCREAVDSKTVVRGQGSGVSSDKGARSGEAVFDAAGLPTDHGPLTTDVATAAEKGVRLALALLRFWIHRGHLAEGLRWLEEGLARSGHLSPALRAAAFLATAHLASSRGGRDQSRSLLRSARAEQERVVMLARASGTPAEIAAAVLVLAEIAKDMDDVDAAWELGQEARERLQALGDRLGLLRALAVVIGIALPRRDWEVARALLEERLAICREVGASEALVHTLGALGHLVRDQGDYAQARAFYSESLELRRKAGQWVALAQSFEDLAALARRGQQHERAIRLLGAGEAFCETLGARPPVAIDVEYERTVAEGRAALGEAAFAAAWAEGRAMSLDEAVEYALGEEG